MSSKITRSLLVTTFRIHPTVRGVRHMPSVLTGARAEPRHGLSQGLLPGRNGSLAPSPGTQSTSNNGNSQHACLQVSPRHPSGHFPTQAFSVPCIWSVGSVHGHPQKWHLQHMMKTVFWFRRWWQKQGHGLLGSHLQLLPCEGTSLHQRSSQPAGHPQSCHWRAEPGEKHTAMTIAPQKTALPILGISNKDRTAKCRFLELSAPVVQLKFKHKELHRKTDGSFLLSVCALSANTFLSLCSPPTLSSPSSLLGWLTLYYTAQLAAALVSATCSSWSVKHHSQWPTGIQSRTQWPHIPKMFIGKIEDRHKLVVSLKFLIH